ncbi:conjugal transfer protein TraG [Bombella intestini]|uniref:Conjugal transfer protein TraG n=1 Tax=Bombella intestini TaxID=1539051 RepID=A0A1S8GSC7_9PROT|nr:type IV secretory system conjugative DNA transfer family protein [Bombella intestini]OOL19953.1 conjugal transfer protein TraG [Bombella intestini]
MAFANWSPVMTVRLIVGIVLAFAGWTVVASLVFLAGTGLFSSFDYPFYQWWLYLYYGRDNPVVVHWLKIGAGAGGTAILVMAVVIAAAARRSMAQLFRRSSLSGGGVRASVRGVTGNHGHAEWMTMKFARMLFPGPSPEYGGVVVGEAYRVDEDKGARLPFMPKDSKTWGMGGHAPLLIDPCESGSTHSLVFAGPGSFKSTSAVTTLTMWTGSVVVLDPSTELGPMLRPFRESLGHQVHELNLGGGIGFNVLDWIDINSPEAITNIQDVVSWICRESGGGKKDSNSDFFDRQGRNLITCLLAHMLYDPDLPAEQKTLRTLRSGLSMPQDDVRALLKIIHETSASTYARQIAGAVMGLVEETFSGVYGSADDKTSWLSNPAFAELVSGNSFRSSDIMNGGMDVFVQLPLRALENTPEIGRTIVGALLNSVYEADGRIQNRVLFLLDEVARLGPMRIMATARDAGRKYGITLRLLYQSVGQLEEQWGREGKRAWYDAAVHRTYVAISDLETAKELEETFGNYGVVATSGGSNKGSSSKGLGGGGRSHGTNVSYSEMSRPLIRREELLNNTRVDEAFVVVRGASPLRCGVPIYFRRPEIKEKIAASRFGKSLG